MKTTFEISERSQSFIINFSGDKDFRMHFVDIENEFESITLKIILSKKGLEEIKKALEPYKQMEFPIDPKYHFPFVKLTPTLTCEFAILKLQYELNVIFKTSRCRFYFNFLSKDGMVIIEKEDAKYIQKRLSEGLDNW